MWEKMLKMDVKRGRVIAIGVFHRHTIYRDDLWSLLVPHSFKGIFWNVVHC